jgi:4a-hydroxytetrahydrobiopterin dehydratase
MHAADNGGCQFAQEVVGMAAAAGEPDDGKAVLGYARMHEANAIDPLGHGSTGWMQEIDPAKPLSHAMDVEVSVARERGAAGGSGGGWRRCRR